MHTEKIHTVQMKDGTTQACTAENCDKSLEKLGIKKSDVSYVSADADYYSSDYPYDNFDFNR